MNKKAQETFDKFCHDLHNSIAQCMKNGTAGKLIIGTDDGEKTVTIDIYRSKEDATKMNDIFREAVIQASDAEPTLKPTAH